jgi:hypothetical protein
MAPMGAVVNAAGAWATVACERSEAELRGCGCAHHQKRGGAVRDAGGIGRGHRAPILAEGRLEPGDAGEITAPWPFVLGNEIALYLDGDDLRVERPVRDGAKAAPHGLGGVGVLLLACETESVGALLGEKPHQLTALRVFQPVIGHVVE